MCKYHKLKNKTSGSLHFWRKDTEPVMTLVHQNPLLKDGRVTHRTGKVSVTCASVTHASDMDSCLSHTRTSTDKHEKGR